MWNCGACARINQVDASILITKESLEDLLRGALTIFSFEKLPVGSVKGWKALALYFNSRKGWSVVLYR